MQLRIAWGGGEPRTWRGHIAVTQGVLEQPRPLGIEAYEPGSLVLDAVGRLQINQRNPRADDGVDLLVHAPLEARLVVQLSPTEDALGGQVIEIPLTDLVLNHHNEPLDDQNNRLLVHRTPGDRLPVFLDRQSLVFSPGETFRLKVVPRQLGVTPGNPVSLRATLMAGRTSKVLWSAKVDRYVAPDGGLGNVPAWEIDLPTTEGVYDIEISLHGRRLRDRVGPAKPIVHRKVQLVVIDESPPPVAGTTQRLRPIIEIDAANPKWWDTLTRLRRLNPISSRAQGPSGNKRSSTWEHGGERFVRLDPEGWESYPLPLSRPGIAHVVEVEYPLDVPQTLGISIVEPGTSDAVMPIGLDSGVDLAQGAYGAASGVGRHRLIFWPKTKTPRLRLSNHRRDGVAVFGKIRVLTGPDRLPALPAVSESGDRRLLAGYFSRPLFPENFSAGQASDPITHHRLDDWLTFYEGGSRLVEYLKHIGYGGATISVLCEGSTIYPTRLLQPTPKYDTGVFFSTGQDPLRKDVLEMLFRLFDREGLKLIPAVQFSAPLPELERLVQRGGPESVGIEWTDAEGRTWRERKGTRDGLAPYYNPLNKHVQEAMLNVVRELAERYGDHPSFAGLTLQLSPDGYAQLPGAEWGFDDNTIQRFQNSSPVLVPGKGSDRLSQRAAFLLGDGRKAWLAWRASKLAGLHRKMLVEITRRRKSARLYLAAAEMIRSPQIQQALQPALPRRTKIDQAMLELGIDAKQYERHPGIVLLRPQRIAPITAIADQAANLEMRGALEVDRYFASGEVRGCLLFHEPQQLWLPLADAVNRPGQEPAYTWLAAQISPAGEENRRRFAHNLAALDAQVIFDGGWMLPLGQEDALRDLVDAYRHLPATPFEPAPLRPGPDTRPGRSPRADDGYKQPVVVRTLSTKTSTYIYLVNDSPWPVSVEVQLDVPKGCRIESLGAATLPPLDRDGKAARWKLQMRPYQLLAGRADAPRLTVKDWNVDVPDWVRTELQDRIRDLGSRIDTLKNPPAPVALLNPGFELQSRAGASPGWDRTPGMDASIHLDTSQKRSGAQSMKLQSNGPIAWIRSASIKPPRLGRLQLSAQLRTTDPMHQPPVRLVIEGRLNGRPYYRYASAGFGEPNAPITDEWRGFMVPFNELPRVGLEHFRVGVDLNGSGEVWVDDIELIDLIFEEGERRELEKMRASVVYHWRSNEFGDCVRLLDGYWPRFLTEHVAPQVRMATRPNRPPAPGRNPRTTPSTGTDRDAPPPKDEKPSFGKKLQNLLPKWLRF